MPVVWNLKKWLAVERDIYRPSELQARLIEKVGVKLSIQAISALVNGTPDGLRFRTMQALCNALECELGDFCRVVPDSKVERQKQRRESGRTPVSLYGSKGHAKNDQGTSQKRPEQWDDGR